MWINHSSFDTFFPPPKPGRNTQYLWPNRVHWIETKLRKSNNEEVKLDRVKRYVEKLLRFHIELARWEEEYTENTIRKAVIRGGCLVNVRKLTHAIEVDIAWKNHLDTEWLAYIRWWMDKICAWVDDGDRTKSIADSMIETDWLSQNMPNILFWKEILSIEDLISKNGEFSFFITGTNSESELMETVYAAFHTIPDVYGMMQLVKIYVHDTIGIAVALEWLETHENHLIGRPQAIQYLRSLL